MKITQKKIELPKKPQCYQQHINLDKKCHNCYYRSDCVNFRRWKSTKNQAEAIFRLKQGYSGGYFTENK